MRAINEFANLFDARLRLDRKLMVEKQNKYFLLNEKLKSLIAENFFYAGVYLGEIKNEKFFPSFILLRMIAAEEKINKIVVDEKTAWLFICGRDIFKRGILKTLGSKKEGAYTLILNQYGECLGFGRITHNLDQEKRGVAVKNIFDIGDFLRREK
jgi:ribosome biogenesis protein Nip4